MKLEPFATIPEPRPAAEFDPAVVTSEPDEMVVVRWTTGILPELASALGFDPEKVRDLPGWLKFPVNATTGTIIQPAFDFLAHMARTGGRLRRETCNAYAYDLRSFFEFLAHHNLAWDEVTQPAVDAFVLHMACADLVGDPDASPDEWADHSATSNDDHTDASLGLSRSTIRRRVAALHSFYCHAFPGEPRFDKRSARGVGRRPDELVRPITLKELPAFLSSLGPKPSKWTGIGTSRLWCCCLLALTSGIRRVEVCGLDVDQFRALRIDASEPLREYPITLRVTKGGRRRSILLPGWLIEEILVFIDGERAASAGDAGLGEPLFINHRRAKRSPLSRIKPATLSFDFRNAMLAADIRRMHPAFRYGAGASSRLHTFHDLRHTCACLQYLSFRQSENPWVEVQNRLGHKFLKTTTDVYLRYVDEMQDRPIDLRQSLVQEMLAS